VYYNPNMSVSLIEGEFASALPEKYVYESLYVSLGGKYCEPTVSFCSPAYMSGKYIPTNALYQIIPAFLRYPTNPAARHVVLLVDCFGESLVQNLQILKKMVAAFPHIDVWVYDTEITVDTIGGLTEAVVEYAVDHGISPAKFLMCNYIKFRACGIEQVQFEYTIPRIIQKHLAKPFADCLYQWFGYQFYTYNLVYRFRTYTLSRHLEVLKLLNMYGEDMPVVSGNAASMFMVPVLREARNKEVLVEFMSKTVDITSYPKRRDAICSHLVDFVREPCM